MINNIFEQLKRDEGFRANPYICPGGALSVGYGHNLEACALEGETYPMTVERATELLTQDLSRNWTAFMLNNKHIDWAKIKDCYIRVLKNMSFQLGPAGLSKFKNMLAAMQRDDLEAVIKHMKDSLWYKQTTNRAERLIKQLREGAWQ